MLMWVRGAEPRSRYLKCLEIKCQRMRKTIEEWGERLNENTGNNLQIKWKLLHLRFIAIFINHFCLYHVVIFWSFSHIKLISTNLHLKGIFSNFLRSVRVFWVLFSKLDFFCVCFICSLPPSTLTTAPKGKGSNYFIMEWWHLSRNSSYLIILYNTVVCGTIWYT